MAKVAPLGSYFYGKTGAAPQMPAWAQGQQQEPYTLRMQPTTLAAASGAPTPAQTASDYLVSLSRSSERGKAYAKTADSVRAMIRELGTTNDPTRRRAIVETLKRTGFINN